MGLTINKLAHVILVLSMFFYKMQSSYFDRISVQKDTEQACGKSFFVNLLSSFIFLKFRASTI